jgi:segregation and condensation protein B
LEREEAKKVIEAIIFASDYPVTEKEISKTFDNEIKEKEIEAIVNDLNEEYSKSGRAFKIERIAGGFSFLTLPEYHGWLVKSLENAEKPKLTVKSLETLAIIAYKQPVTRIEIDAIRGVNSDYLIRQLLEKGLISIVGRAQAPGQPLLYGTSERFLRYFGLNEIEDLPRLKEIDELIRNDDRFLRQLNQFDIQELDAGKLGMEFVDKIKSVILKENADSGGENGKEENKNTETVPSEEG